MKINKKISILLIVLILAIAISGCNQKASIEKVINLGEWEENTYKNDYFGMTLVIPEEWTILTQEEVDYITSLGQEQISENNEELAENIDYSLERTLHFVYSYKYPLNYIEEFNPNFISLAENLSLIAGIAVKTGSDYLELTKSGLEEAGLGYTFEEMKSEEIDGKKFDVMYAETDIYGFDIKQKYYAAIESGYALIFIISYTSDEQLSELNSILDNISFTK